MHTEVGREMGPVGMLPTEILGVYGERQGACGGSFWAAFQQFEDEDEASREERREIPQAQGCSQS